MAKSTVDRQAAYRARQTSAGADGNGQRCISMWLSTGAALALARLARRYGVMQRELVETMVLAEDSRVLATIAMDSPESEEYFSHKAPFGGWDAGFSPSPDPQNLGVTE